MQCVDSTMTGTYGCVQLDTLVLLWSVYTPVLLIIVWLCVDTETGGYSLMHAVKDKRWLLVPPVTSVFKS